MEAFYRSVCLTVEERGVVRLSGGKELAHWHVRFQDGNTGIVWGPVVDDQQRPMPCPFTEGKPAYYTMVVQQGKENKIRPFDRTEYDRQMLITRSACVNSAAALGADLENWKDYAESILAWVTER